MPQFALAADTLRSGSVLSDRDFDALYPEPLRFVSGIHWTPIAVAARAAQLLVTAGAKQILDVGSGIGKFCIVGALSTDGAKFTGVEKRPGLVDEATRVADRLGAVRARFLYTDVMAVRFSAFDGVYMYNPFYEQIDDRPVPIDDTIVRSDELYDRYVFGVVRKLSKMRAGTKLVTYHGFGADPPPSFRCVREEPAGSDCLALWIKEPQGSSSHSRENSTRWQEGH